MDVASFLHGSAIKRPTTHNRPEPTISPVIVLRYDNHRGALRPTTSRLSKKNVLREHREARLVQVISRCLSVSGRLPSGRLHVAENERRKARLAHIGKSSGAWLNHHVPSYGFRVRLRQRQWARPGVWYILRSVAPPHTALTDPQLPSEIHAAPSQNRKKEKKEKIRPCGMRTNMRIAPSKLPVGHLADGGFLAQVRTGRPQRCAAGSSISGSAKAPSRFLDWKKKESEKRSANRAFHQ